MNKTKLLVPALAVFITGGALLGATGAYAQGNGTATYRPIAQKIADKFGLKVEDVQSVFDEERASHQAEFKQKYEERLTTAVTEGKITEAQKQLIIQKHTEMQTKMKENFDALKDLSPEERKTKMETERQELETWAEQNGIDMKYVMPRMFKFEKHGGFRGERGDKDEMMWNKRVE